MSLQIESNKCEIQWVKSILHILVMVESIVSAVLAVVTGGFILTSRINTKIDSVDKRIDEVELCIARSYISKQDFATTLERVEAHMIRIEDKLDELVLTQTRPR